MILISAIYLLGRNPKTWERLRSLFTFTQGETRGVLWLLPLLAVLAALIVFANRPRFEKSFLEQAAEDTADGVPARTAGERSVPDNPETSDPGVGELFVFDPNTVTLQELCRLGFSPRTAAGIIKYRERGKRFEIPEDFATCYGVSLDTYTRLEPYIVISEESRARQQNSRGGGARNTSGGGQGGPHDREERAASGNFRNREAGAANGTQLTDFDPNLLDADGFAALGFSPAQAAVIVKYRTSIGGFRTAEDFGRCYVVSEQALGRLAPYIRIAPPEQTQEAAPSKRPIELNAADSTELRSVSGIGEVLVVRIMDYRKRLGGFARIEQLAEIPGMTEENFSRIAEQILVDSCKIQKIDINFAPHQSVVDVLGNHPYITAQGLRKLLKNRQLKGGWRSIGDMVSENIVTQRQAERLAPYLIFRTE